MIYKTVYKDRPAAAISCETFTALFLPKDGAKLASIKSIDGDELLAQADGERYMRLGLDSEYVDSECSAFDDMFPTIDACVVGEYAYPDHGEVCRRSYRCTASEKELVFSCEVESANAEFSKTVSIEAETLKIRYVIKNLNAAPLPYIWAGHMMFAGEYGAYVTGCFPRDAVKTMMFGKAPDSGEINILGRFSETGESYKYYYSEAQMPMHCGITYPQTNKTVSVDFDGDAVKYLGVWMNNGSFKGMYNITLEPCTAPFDSPVNAQRVGKGSCISAGGSTEFTMKIRIGTGVKEKHI